MEHNLIMTRGLNWVECTVPNLYNRFLNNNFHWIFLAYLYVKTRVWSSRWKVWLLYVLGMSMMIDLHFFLRIVPIISFTSGWHAWTRWEISHETSSQGSIMKFHLKVSYVLTKLELPTNGIASLLFPSVTYFGKKKLLYYIHFWRLSHILVFN